MKKTRELAAKDQKPRLRLIKGGLWSVRDEKRPVRDLTMKPKAGAGVQGGKASPLLTKYSATGKHYPTVTITS